MLPVQNKQVGIMVSHFGPSQLAYRALKCLNELAATIPGTIGFYENLTAPCINYRCALMHVYEAWSFPGTLIATNLTTAYKLTKFPNPAQRIFYVWDFEWLRFPQKRFSELHHIYAHPSLTLVAKTPEYAKIISEAWNVDVKYCVEDFDPKEIYKLLGWQNEDCN